MRIYVHAGQAHFDELCACAMIRAEIGTRAEIIRVREVPDTTNDDWIVDVGGVYDPFNNRFDHHQDKSLPAAFVLVAKSLGYHDTLKLASWYHIASEIDTNLFGALSDLGVPKERALDVIGGLGVLQSAILRRFEENPNDPFVWNIVDQWFKETVGTWERISRKLTSPKFFKEEEFDRTVLDLRGYGKDSDTHTLSRLLVEALRDSRKKSTVIATIAEDDRGDGLALFRIEDNERVDFSVLDGHPSVVFAHKGGFIAKTKAIDDIELLAILRMSIE